MKIDGKKQFILISLTQKIYHWDLISLGNHIYMIFYENIAHISNDSVGSEIQTPGNISDEVLIIFYKINHLVTFDD